MPTTASFSTIQKRKDFLIASNQGKRFIVGTFILQMMKRIEGHPAPPEARFGFTVTKKMGNAVTRNRIKRRLREALREKGAPHALPGHDYVIISRLKALDCPFPDLLRDMEFAFSRIIVMKNDTSSTRPENRSKKAPKKQP